MGIYIYGAEIPKDRCSSISVYGDGTILLRDGNKIVRLDNCKAIKIKQPHGRLIDAEYLKEHLYQCDINGMPLHIMELDERLACISDVPTVIEAESE